MKNFVAKWSSPYGILILSAFLSVFFYVIKFIFNIVLSKHLLHGLYGDWSLAARFYSLISGLILLGTGAEAKKFLARFLKEHEYLNIEHYIRWNFRLIKNSIFLFLVGLLSFMLTIITLHLFNVKSLESYHLCFYVIFLCPIGAILLLMSNYLQCNQNILLSICCTNAEKSWFQFIIFIIFIYFFHVKFNSQVLFLIFLISVILFSIIEGALFSLLLRAKTTKILLLELIGSLVPINYHKEWLALGVKLMINQSIYLFTCAIDIFLVKLITKSFDQTDYYAAILSITGIIFVISSTLILLLSTKVSSLLSNDKQKEELQALINKTFFTIAIVSSLVFFLLVFFSHRILQVFGNDYVTAQPALIIMLIGYYIGALCSSSIRLLVYSGNENTVLIIAIVEALVLVVLGIVFTLFWGIVGMALATCMSILVKSICATIMVKVKLKLKPLVFI